jgi:hypothetical protein
MDQHIDSLWNEEPEWVNQIDSEHYITEVDDSWLHTVVVTKTGRSI